MVYRKSCFKCGNLGHIAEVCPEPERLCYNCKQPGHESNNCPRVKSVDVKQCYVCGGIGHIRINCPSARTNIHRTQERKPSAQSANNNNANSGGSVPVRCYNCGRTGHFARVCRNRPQAGVEAARGLGNGSISHAQSGRRGGHGTDGGFVGPSSSSVICYNCGGPNHFARDCQAGNKSIKCYQCNKFGHIARDCITSSGEVQRQSKKCYICNEVGHIARDCTSSADKNQNRSKVCYRCNEVGHIARDCGASSHEDDNEDDEDDEDEDEDEGSSHRSVSPAASELQQALTKRRTDGSGAESDVESN